MAREYVITGILRASREHTTLRVRAADERSAGWAAIEKGIEVLSIEPAGGRPRPTLPTPHPPPVPRPPVLARYPAWLSIPCLLLGLVMAAAVAPVLSDAATEFEARSGVGGPGARVGQGSERLQGRRSRFPDRQHPQRVARIPSARPKLAKRIPRTARMERCNGRDRVHAGHGVGPVPGAAALPAPRRRTQAGLRTYAWASHCPVYALYGSRS